MVHTLKNSTYSFKRMSRTGKFSKTENRKEVITSVGKEFWNQRVEMDIQHCGCT
jgi:hypothetical protein